MELVSLTSPTLAAGFFTTSTTWEAPSVPIKECLISTSLPSPPWAPGATTEAATLVKTATATPHTARQWRSWTQAVLPHTLLYPIIRVQDCFLPKTLEWGTPQEYTLLLFPSNIGPQPFPNTNAEGHAFPLTSISQGACPCLQRPHCFLSVKTTDSVHVPACQRAETRPGF